MLSGWRTIWYFLWRGGAYGAVFGAIAGTFIIPIYLSMIGLAWGAIIGLVMGTPLGIGIHFYNRRAYSQQMDFDEYQSNLVTGAGIATTLITALPLAVLLAPMAGLAAAYITHRYAEDHAHHIIKRKNEGLLPDTQSHMEKKGTVSKFSDYFLAKSKCIYYAGLVIVTLAGLFAPAITMNIDLGRITLGNIAWLIALIVGWSIYFQALVMLVGGSVGVFIQILNRVVFSPEWTPEQYKRWVMVSAGLFTLVITPIVGLIVGAPILAIIAMLAARDYADWYFEGEEIDKAKRDASRLAEGEIDMDAEADMPVQETATMEKRNA
jgi:hypothetical protein